MAQRYTAYIVEKYLICSFLIPSYCYLASYRFQLYTMSKQALLDCHDRIRPYIHRTPVLTSSSLNAISGADLYFKCENFQKMGAFKMRGATNAILQLSESQRAKGVVTHSSGNMAQAVSLAAKTLGIPAYIVMPDNAPEVKKAAVRGYGGQITECFPTIEVREKTANEIIAQTGAAFLHPSDDLQVIHGQGTAAMEILEDHPDMDYLCTPVGGGGLLAGTAMAAHHFGTDCEVVAGEPRAADDAYWSLKAGKIIKNLKADTIADGLRTHLGSINFPIIQDHVKTIIRVEEGEIIAAMRLVWERMKIIIEPSCAVPLAAVLLEPDRFREKKVGIIITGGNVDLGKLPF